MTMNVLQNRAQIAEARSQLRRRGLSTLDSGGRRLMRRLKLDPTPAVGDEVKSWDVLQTVSFIEQNLPPEAAVLDIGAYASEVLVPLYRLGFRNLTGVDLNPDLVNSPHSETIRYEISNFMQTPFADGSFDAITSISVIEHGFESERLLKEVARLLRSGGVFIASFDYWPEKIDTTGTRFFGMDWIIFSMQDVEAFVADARAHGLAPAGALDFEAAERTVECGGRHYTFGWLVLQKTK